MWGGNLSQITINLQPWRHQRRVQVGIWRIFVLVIVGVFFYTVSFLIEHRLKTIQCELKASAHAKQTQLALQQRMHCEQKQQSPRDHSAENQRIKWALQRISEDLPKFAVLRAVKVNPSTLRARIRVPNSQQIPLLLDAMPYGRLDQVDYRQDGYDCDVQGPIVPVKNKG